MRIDNTYTQRQPNFGRLKSITYQNHFNPYIYPDQFATILKAIEESKALNEFFKKYDVDIYFHREVGTYRENDVYLMLKTTVPKTIGKNLHPTLFIDANEGGNEPSIYNLLYGLARKIETIEFSDLKYKLDDALKALKEIEKRKNARTKVDKIKNSPPSPEKSEMETFFEKLFDWLK